jgi:isochorismate hydrolase
MRLLRAPSTNGRWPSDVSDKTDSDARINGAAPDAAAAVLIVVDMLSDFESKEMAPLFRSALRAAKQIALLRKRTDSMRIPTLYVNDNVGRWRSAGQTLVERAAKTERGRAILELIAPRFQDYLILKPKHSIFYATPIDTLLEYMSAKALILTGLTGTQCILFSAMDAHVRDFDLYIPRDCVVCKSRKDASMMDYLFRHSLMADTRAAGQLRIPSMHSRYASKG